MRRDAGPKGNAVRRVGIVGSGNMGSWHALRWQALPVELAGFYDANGAQAVALAARYGGQAFASLEQLLASSDIVDICTPPTEHAAATIAAARAGRHIVCEKPIARHLADAQAMIAACETAGVRLFVAHVVRFFPEFARAKELADSGALGRLGVVRSVRGGAPPGHSGWFADVAQSGGVILDVAIHDIDYLGWVCGDVARVFARGLTFRGLNVDHALISLRFANGIIGHVEASWAFPAGNFRTSFELAGTEGLLMHDSDDVQPLQVRYHPGQAPASPPYADPAPLDDDPYFREFQHVLDALDSGAEFLVTPHDALAALRVALAALASLRSGRPVDVATFEEAL
jgi:predicted dehydrogenase